MQKLLFLIILLLFSNISAQSDLTWLKIKKFKIANLEAQIQETSALNFLNNRLFTLNDSGNASELYELHPETGKILNTFRVAATNNDWEALANDGTYFYVADIGNNRGSRKALRVYKIHVDSIAKEFIPKTTSDFIEFHYPEQNDFNKNTNNHNFDAESIVYIKGNLHIFTKEWESYKTTHYVINTETSLESLPAQKREDYNLGYLATDAAYFENRLYIIGYTKKLEVYLSVFDENEKGDFFSKKPRKYYLGMSSSLGQIEGIAVNAKGIYISGERFRMKPFNVPQQLYFIPSEHFKF